MGDVQECLGCGGKARTPFGRNVSLPTSGESFHVNGNQGFPAFGFCCMFVMFYTHRAADDIAAMTTVFPLIFRGKGHTREGTLSKVDLLCTVACISLLLI